MNEDTSGGYSYDFDFENEIAIVKSHGRINIQQTLKTMDDVVNDPRYKTSYKILIDLTDMDFHPTFKELGNIQDKLISLKPKFGNKMALVMTGLLKAIGDLVSELTKTAGLKVKSFYSRNRAIDWLMEE